VRGQISRRTIIRGLGTAAVATAGVAGCLDRSSGSVDSLTIAYVPIFPNMQHYVMEQRGYYDELPVEVSVERFNAGPSVVKAFASGDVDVALFGITPAMVLIDKGTAAGVLAANSRNGFKIMASAEVVDRFEQEGRGAFDSFERDTGRKLRVGAPPDGSVPDIVLRYWIEQDLGVGELESAITKSSVPPAKAVQTIQSGDIDATIIQEPFATIIDHQEGFSEITWSGNILKNHPVTVLFATQRVIEHSEVSQALVDQHVRATEFIAASPEAASVEAASVIGSGVSESLASEAMGSRASDFVSDPHSITDQASTMTDFVAEVGNIAAPVSTADLFAFDAYDATQQ